MKLHLPKGLFIAVLAACAAQTSWGETYDLLKETTGWTLCSKDGVNSNTSPVFATGDSGRYIDMTKTGVWKQDLATYELSSRYTVIGGNEISFNVSYNLPGGVNNAVLSMGFVGLDQSLIIGTLGYKENDSGGTKIGYGTSSDTWSDIHLGTNANGGPTADWVGITEAVVNNFQAFDGVTRKAGTYSWSGTVTLSNGSYLLNLYMTEPGGTEAVQCLTNVNLGSSFDINRMYFSYDGDQTNTYLTEFSVTGTKTERPIYSTVLSEATQNAESGTWSSAGQGIGYVDMKVTDGNSVLEIGSTAENGSSMSLAEGTNVYAAGATQGTVTLNSSQPVTIRRIFADSGATLNMNAALNAGALLSIDGPGTVKLIADQSLSSLNVNNTVAEIADGTTIEISGRDTSFLSSISGKGKVRFTGSEDLYLAGAANTNTYTATPKKWTTGFTGTISLSGSTKLILGSNASGSYTHVGWAVDLSSTTLEINGGGIHFNGHYSTIGTLDVNASDTLHIEDTLGPNNTSTITAGLTINTLNLDADLKLTKNWKSRVDIGVLQGSGDLNIAASDNNEAWIINLGGISGDGDISVGAKATLNISGEMSGSTSITGAGTVNIAESATVSGTMSFADIRLNHTLQNTGSVTLNGNVYASTVDNYASGVVDGMKMTYSDGENGYITSGAYFLVQSQGEGQVAVSEGKKLYIGDTAIGTIAKDTATNSLYVGYVDENVNSGIYYINTTDFTVDGAADNKAVNATKYVVAEGRTLTISADQNSTMTAARILTETEGAGNIKMTTDIVVNPGAASKLGGTLTIQDASLKINTAGNHDTIKTITTDFSSFSAITLNNGTIEYLGDSTTFNNVTVQEKGANIKLRDMGTKESVYTLSGTTKLEGDLNISKMDGNAWKYTVAIEKLTGEKDLSFTSSHETGKLIINSLQGYTGAISMTKGEDGAAVLEMSTGGSVSLGGLTLADGAVATVTTTGELGLEQVSLSGASSLTLFNSGDPRETTIGSLDIKGSGTIATKRDANCYQGTINIESLTNTGNPAELTLVNGSKTTKTTTYNLNGGAFAGTINVEGNADTGGDRPIHLNINSKAVAEKAVINFKEPTNSNTVNFITLGIGTDGAKVAGLNGTTTNAATIKSTADNATRTLEIIAAEGTNYTTNATIDSSIKLKKSGAGKQTFTGSVNSTDIAVVAGELAFTAAEAMNVSALNVSNVGTLTVENNAAKGTISTSNATLAGGATVNANLKLNAGATLTLDVAQDRAVALDGVLTVMQTEQAPKITLAGTVLDTLAGLQAPGSGEVVLFSGVDTLEMGGHTYSVGSDVLTATSGVKLSEVFRSDSVNLDDYYIGFNANGDVYAGLIVPEPTTATLSLLALAGLCARRRRASR